MTIRAEHVIAFGNRYQLQRAAWLEAGPCALFPFGAGSLLEPVQVFGMMPQPV